MPSEQDSTENYCFKVQSSDVQDSLQFIRPKEKLSKYELALRERLVAHLVELGFLMIDEKTLVFPNDKEAIRKAHRRAVLMQLSRNREMIEKFDAKFIEDYIIDGSDLDVANIEPCLVAVKDDHQSALFNWTKLHWSIPVSAGYGRRLRYLVIDKTNGALIGIIGLGDPVYALNDRDKFIGWTRDMKAKMLRHLMDAFVLGAVPPYSYVLGGKLVASLVTSPRIRIDFRTKYKGTKSLISGREFDGKLAAITTASALGKSSIYDRIRIEGGATFEAIGWSKGSGDFHLMNEDYGDLREIVNVENKGMKNPKWGKGLRNKRATIKGILKILELPQSLQYHNIRRQLYFVSLGKKSLPFLRGETNRIYYYSLSQEEIAQFIKKRWMIPRSNRNAEYRTFRKESYSIAKLLDSKNS